MDFTSLSYTWSPQGIALPVLAIIAAILCCPPLAWHIKNRNFPASCLIIWVMIDNIFNFINALIWPTDDISSWWSGVGLCDVETKIQVGSYVGVVGALACVFRGLAIALDTDRAVLIPSKAQRTRKLVLELALCAGFPLYMMITHYIVQPHRFMIFAIAGCTSSYDTSWPSTALHFIWPPIICLVDVYYCVLVIYRLNKYRHQFADILVSSGSDYNRSRFVRLFTLSALMLLVNFPVQLYVLYVNVSYEWLPYSWSEIHSPDWYRIEMFPTAGQVFYDRWIQVAAGYSLFFFFGFGSDATLMYRSVLLKLGLGKWFPALHHPHISGERKGSSSSRFGSIGSRAKYAFRRKHESMRSISSGSSRLNSSPQANTQMPSPPSPYDIENCFANTNLDLSSVDPHPGNPAPLAPPTPPQPIWRPFTLGTMTHDRFPSGSNHPEVDDDDMYDDDAWVPRSRFSSESTNRFTSVGTTRLQSTGTNRLQSVATDRFTSISSTVQAESDGRQGN